MAACAIVLKLAAVQAAVPQLPLCSWPVESTGEGILNVATQDTITTYWFMPVPTSVASSIVIQGIYPKARLFNFASYDEKGGLIGTLNDTNIVRDAGSTNPFSTPVASGVNSYTVSLSTGGSGSANTLNMGSGPLAYIVYRVILPDQGLDRSGGVGAPVVSLVSKTGGVRRLQSCPFAVAGSSIGNMIPFLVASGFSDAAAALEEILNQRSAPGPTCSQQASGSAAVPFGPAPGTDFFPNPPTVYLQTPNFCFQLGKIMVVRGKALVFPNTY
ncbi:MAG: hypothetical protein JOZ58_17915, partial [Acetobacteraceae bacterium]|nr:hypothetical protein [Acetobacteraceae bacterium]